MEHADHRLCGSLDLGIGKPGLARSDQGHAAQLDW